MENVILSFNGKEYVARYNMQTEYYEIVLDSPVEGGLYNVNIKVEDIVGNFIENTHKVQVFAKEKIHIDTNKTFMWIFNYKDFSVKDIVEFSDYEISIDEETNVKSNLKVLKNINAKSRDIVAIKKDNNVIYWGTVEQIKNNDGEIVYQYFLKYITNMFNQKIQLKNEELIKNKGIEDFIAKAITDNFIDNVDTFINKEYLQVNIKTHTKLNTSVSNVENGIYNLHTFMTNCTQNYNIAYDFEILNGKLVISIENKEIKKELIDVNAHAISNYTEIFTTDVVSKVVVLTNTNTYTLYLKNDRTTTTNMLDENRADGKTETVFIEKYEEAKQKALDIIKSNSYNHNITFKLHDRYLKVGTPVAIKTKNSIILDTYISAVKFTQNKFIEYTCGNIRIKFIDKLLKERKD